MAISTITFPETFSASSKKVQLSTSYQSINECLSLLLTSAKGELLGDPQYGTRLMQYIFNYSDEILYELIRSEIVQAVRTYEKRIDLTESDVIVIDEGDKVSITLNYYVKDEAQFETFTLALERQDNSYGY